MKIRNQIAINEYYHIFNRGNSKQDIFKDHADYQRFLVLLYLCNSKDTLKLHTYIRSNRDFTFEDFFTIETGEKLVAIGAYCLLPNHFHLLVKELTENGISKFMQKLMTSYTMYFNNKYERVGTLYEGPFRNKHIDSDTYLQYLIAYILLNPVTLDYENNIKHSTQQIKETVERKLSSYKYSSYLDLKNKRPTFKILDPNNFPKNLQNYHDIDLITKEYAEFNLNQA